MRLSKKRREAIILCFVRTTKGCLVEDLGKLLAAMGARLGGPVTESELRRAIQWGLRQSRRSGAAFERRLREERQRLADGGAAP